MHLHCLVPAGGVDAQGLWKGLNYKGFLLPCKLLARRFRKNYLRGLRDAYEDNQLEFFGKARCFEDREQLTDLFIKVQLKKWNVHLKEPANNLAQLQNYLARYVNRVAITNHRIEAVSNNKITISHKQYSAAKRNEIPPVVQLDLKPLHFIHKLLQHVLPHRFQKVRYYGLHATTNKNKLLQLAQQLGQQPAIMRTVVQILKDLLGHQPHRCPRCNCDNLLKKPIPADRRWILTFLNINPSNRSP